MVGSVKLNVSVSLFARFRSRDFAFKDAPRSGLPIQVDDKYKKAMIEANRHISTTRAWCIAKKVFTAI